MIRQNYESFEDGNFLSFRFDYRQETQEVLKMLGKENQFRIFNYEECEADPEFVAFLSSYKDIASFLSKEYTIIDIGACQAAQGAYFKDFARYIAVEPAVPDEGMVLLDNMEAYHETGESFIKNTLPELCKKGLDLNKTVCISSYVPAQKLREELIPEAFPYFRCTYASQPVIQRLPDECRDKLMLYRAFQTEVIKLDYTEEMQLFAYFTEMPETKPILLEQTENGLEGIVKELYDKTDDTFRKHVSDKMHSFYKTHVSISVRCTIEDTVTREKFRIAVWHYQNIEQPVTGKEILCCLREKAEQSAEAQVIHMTNGADALCVGKLNEIEIFAGSEYMCFNEEELQKYDDLKKFVDKGKAETRQNKKKDAYEK